MKHFEINGTNILYPTDKIQNEAEVTKITRNTLVLVPRSYKWGAEKGEHLVTNIYKNHELSNELISSFYNIRQAKFAQRHMSAEIFDAVIAVNQNKTLDSIKQIHDDSMIRCSTSWKNKRKNRIFSQFEQHGQCAIAFNIDIPIDNLESIFTSKICKGDIITLDFQGNLDDEYLTKYQIHNHDHSVSCSNACNLTERTDSNELLEDRFIPVFISSISQKQTGLIEYFVKNKNFDFFGEEYFCAVDFYRNGTARLNGIIWTFECNILNEELSSISLNGKNLEMDDFLVYLDNSILTTTDNKNIKDFLGVNDEESIKIQNLARSLQVDLNMQDENILLPSYITMFRLKPKPESRLNLQSAKRLLQLCKCNLINLTLEEKMSLSTEEWLEKLNLKAKFDLTDESKLYLDLEDNLYTFNIDQKLNQLIEKYSYFVALYHYALSCSNKQYSVVLRRLKILDSYTYAYNATLLKAFCARIEILPIYSIFGWWNFERKYESTMPDLEDTELSDLLSNHSLVSIPEIFALTDSKKLKDIASETVEYISTHMYNKPKFRRVPVATEESFYLPGGGFYEQCASNVIRHFKRINGEHLLLVETSLYYDLMPKKDGIEIYNLYMEKLDKIPDENTTGVYEKPFPTYILCSNKQILKFRKRRKVLQIPQFHTLSNDYKYSRILLYYPLRPGREIDVNRLG